MAEVSTEEIITFGKGNPYRIIVIDFGIKSNIIRNLVKV